MTEWSADLGAAWLTLRLAATATAILLLLGTPLAWWLATTRWRGRVLVEALVALPLVLPPTVLGFYLLVLLGTHGPGGWLAGLFGARSLAFTFSGLVIGSVLYSLPFMVQPLQTAFTNAGAGVLQAAATLGAGPLDRFLTVAAPLAARGFVTGAALAFAHTLGEFGVVLMIGGNIPGRTQVLSVAIFNHVQALEYTHANYLAGALLLASFAMLVTVYAANRRFSFGAAP